ncbi:hypothetical protein [Streptomyces sp. MH60]|uniref:hypothetical protein n=1 Tax=Streptomyces sp. MH60 TaxID=1940758 RepID=UPI000CEE0F96|nr:hypothetical protein [Streptomyces sp. MH60]
MTTDLSFGSSLDGFAARRRAAAGSVRRAREIEGKRYDVEDAEDFHDDLRTSFDAALRNALKTPGMAVAHFGCATCATIVLTQRSTF